MTGKLQQRVWAALLSTAIFLTLTGCGDASPNALPVPTASASPEVPTQPSAAAETTPVHTPVKETESAVKPEYLNYKFAYSITGESLGDMLAETANKECTESFSKLTEGENFAQLCEDWIYKGITPGDYSCGAVFLTWSADLCGLIDIGTFVRCTDLEVIYRHLTGTDEFPAEPLTDAVQLGGEEYNVQLGDILFWTDDNGTAINAGIVTQTKGRSVTVAICSSENRVASFLLEANQKDEHAIKYCSVVRMTYPCNEQIVFLFLVNELGYNNAVACGAMANIYCESLFRPNIEESKFSEGYGICQWTGARRAALEMWCSANGLDHSVLINQLAFMKKELETDVAGDLDWRLRKLGSTEQDACDAGIVWCDMYENPKNDEAKQRGELARQFYGAYSGHPFM